MHLETSGRRYEVTLVGAQVCLVTLDYRLGINLLDAENRPLHIVIATKFSLIAAAGKPAITLLPEENSTELGALAVALRFREAEACLVRDDSTLHLRFAGGVELDVPADPDYEAWELDGPGFKVVATPGAEP